MPTQKQNSIRGKKARASGRRFEAKVRKSLEDMGWIVDKWTNTIEQEKEGKVWKIVPAKRSYNPFRKAMVIGTGFPDFIAFRTPSSQKKSGEGFCEECKKKSSGEIIYEGHLYCEFCGEVISITKEFREFKPTEIIGVEVKSNGYLDKMEKDMCKWLLERKIFSRILIAKKKSEGRKIEVEYKEFEHDKT